MSVTKTAYDHSYYYLQRAKELHRRDVITHRDEVQLDGTIYREQVVTTMKTLQGS